MATGTRGTNTMVEGLRKLLSSITDLKMTEDADLPFLINLETTVLQRIKTGADNALSLGGAGGAGGGTPGMGAPMGIGGMSSPPPGMGSAPGTPGLQQGPIMPNPDELRRVLSQR